VLSSALTITRRIANFRGNETQKAYNGSDNNKNRVRLTWSVKDDRVG